MWKFHRVCGKNVSLENDCTTAKRLNPTDTSDHGVCFTNTTLVNEELFEIQVEELVTRWGGSFSTGNLYFLILQTYYNVLLITLNKCTL